MNCILCTLTLAMVFLLSGCAHGTIVPDLPPLPSIAGPAPEPLDPPKSGPNGKVDVLAQAQYDLGRSKEQTAQLQARVDGLTKQRDDDARRRDADAQRAQAVWISRIALIVAALAGVAAFLVPTGKGILASLSLGCVVVAACAQAYQAAAPYLVWAGGAILLGGGVWAICSWRKQGVATRTAADHGDRMEDWLRSDLLPQLDDKMRALAEKTIADAKVESQQVAERLGVHGVIQDLRGKTTSLWQRLRTAVAGSSS